MVFVSPSPGSMTKSIAYLKIALTVVCLLLWTDCCHGSAAVTLRSNVTFGGLICPTPAVAFTCTAVDATFVEWLRNNDRITVFLPGSTLGPRIDSNVPSGFEIELTAVEQVTQQVTANFTTTLTADLSVLVNGGDQISCLSIGGNDSINIAYTELQSAPPAPLSSHTFSSGLRDGEVTLTVTWDETFTTTNAVEMYCVRSDLCPKQCVEPDTPFSCPGLLAGGEYMFWVTAFNCHDQEGEETRPLVVRPQVPNPPVILSILATYNSTSLLRKIDVSWEASDQVFISNQYKVTNIYIVTFEDNNGGTILRNHLVTNCVAGVCNATLMLNGLLSQGRNFTVSVIAKNLVGESTRSHSPSVIYHNSDSYLEPSLTAKNCSVSAVCSSATLSELTKCTVNFGTDPLYTQFTQSMSGVLNTVLQFSLIGSHSIYFYQATVNVSSTLTVNVQGELIAMPTAECTRQDGMLSVGVAVAMTLVAFVVAFILGALFGILLLHLIQCHSRHGNDTRKHEYYNVGAHTKPVKSTQKEKASALNQEEPVVEYDDISINTAAKKESKEKLNVEKIKLEENKAYGPREMAMGNQGISLKENVSYVPVNQ